MTDPTNETRDDGAAAKRGIRKTLRGQVVSNKMDKTLAVMIERRFRHPVYEKYVSQRTKVYAHDEQNEGNVGDVVQLMETRRLSKKKRWRLVRILQKAEG